MTVRTIGELRRWGLVAMMLGLLVPSPGAGQSAETQPTSPFDGLRLRNIGPATPAGRVDDFAVLESDPAVFYVATATGGLWKTTNNGTTFATVFDGERTSSIGAVAIAPADANLVWVGTGENNNRQSSSWGEGVYKSTDGGQTWSPMGLASSRHVSRIIVDPVDHDVVYVAALGSLWGPGGERGVYKTTDGGLTWRRVLHVDADTGATELVMDPTNNKVLYAATYQRRRSAWGFNGGGPGSGIHKSTDAGESWTELTEGVPAGDKGRIGLDIYRADPNVLYARIQHAEDGGVYRSDDAGASWTKLSSTNPRPMYFSQIRIDPQNASRIYVLGVQLFVSDDGGRTFRNDGAQNIHVDFHAMWINPENPDHILLGGDGGVGISYDRSETYVFLPNMPLGQFYHVSYDMGTPYTVCGGLQDNSTWCGPSAVRTATGIVNDEWFIIGGGDGFVALVDPADPTIMYAESQNGRMNRVDRITNERKPIRPEPKPDETDYRWNWDTPMLLSPHDPATVFVAANRLFRSTDRGHAWEVVSPDLTTATDRDELELMSVMGSDITLARNDGVSAYGTLTTFAESPRVEGVYYTGSDDGLVQVSRDAGATWTDVTTNITGVPAGTFVSRVEPSAFADGTVYVTFDGHRSNDFTPYVYTSPDYGATWRSIIGGLPAGEIARTIKEDTRNADVLYLGTETGVFATVTGGQEWHRLKGNLPTVPVYEIAIHPRDNDLIVGTHGRSIWILDDLRPIQQLADAHGTEAHLFETRPARHWKPANDRLTRFYGDRQFLGENPDRGALVSYYLRDAADEVTITIRDADGAVVRALESPDEGRSAGLNRAPWDLRVEPLTDEALSGGGLDGPLVLPGDYVASLRVDGRDVGETTVTVQGDPEIEVSDADRQARFQTARALHELHGAANAAAVAVRAAHDELTRIGETLEQAEEVAEAVSNRLSELGESLEDSRRRLGLVSGPGLAGVNVRGRIARLKSGVLASSTLPTQTQLRMLEEERAALAEAVQEANEQIEAIRAFVRDLVERELYPRPLSPIAPVAAGAQGVTTPVPMAAALGAPVWDREPTGMSWFHTCAAAPGCV